MTPLLIRRAVALCAALAMFAQLSRPQRPTERFPARNTRGCSGDSSGRLRGGRTKAIAGVPSAPNRFYIAAVNGGIWRTDDAGRTWRPIFDDQSTGSVGSLAVAPSDPNVIYAGSGEGLQRPDLSVGNGIYKSTDGGDTWKHLGLRDGQQIPQIAVDPNDPNRLFVAVLGHPYGPNPERGDLPFYGWRTTFTRVLYRDENTGAYDVRIDPSNPQVVYATLVGGAASAVGNRRLVRTTRERHLQVDRRRRSLDASPRRTSRCDGARRGRDRALEHAGRLRVRRRLRQHRRHGLSQRRRRASISPR